MADSVTNAAAATFPARAGELRRIGTFLNDFCTRQGIGREHCLRLNLVVEELFTNTVRHGHRGDSDAPVWVSVDAEASRGARHLRGHRAALQSLRRCSPTSPDTTLSDAQDRRAGRAADRASSPSTRDYAYLFGRNRIRLTLKQ